MKRFFSALTLVCLSNATWGDALGLYAGAGQWYLSLEGDVGQNGATTTLGDLGFEDQTSNVFWLMLEHPVPVLPNLRLMHSAISATKASTTSQSFIIGGIPINAEVRILTDMDLSHSDATLYYELLDNWVHFDLGVTARYMQGYVEVLTEIGQQPRAELEGTIPLGYANLQLDFPRSGWKIGATGHGVTYQGDKFTDAQARIGYTFELMSAMDIGVNFGYRVLTMRAKEFGDLYADAKISGGFAELVMHF